MEKFSRAVRRHHAKRLKKNRKGYWGRSMPGWARGQNPAMDERELGMVLNNAASCSCPMCGNPRRHFGERTIRELCEMQEELWWV